MDNQQSETKQKAMKFLLLFPIIFPVFLFLLSGIDAYLTEPEEQEEIPCYYDGVLEKGATYRYGMFIYKYKQEKIYNDWVDIPNDIDGWGVAFNNEFSKEPINAMYYCNDIRGIPIVSMSYMFEGSHAETIDMTGFDTSNVVNMRGMFANTMSKTIILKDMDTSKVTDMSYMFSRTLATSLDLSSFDTSNVTNMENMLDIRYGSRNIYVKNEEEYNRLSNSPGKTSDAVLFIKR